MRFVLGLVLATALAATAAADVPGDAAEGKRLHDANCVRCHDSSVYTRKDRSVHSLEALQRQVQTCTHLANRDFSAAQRQDLVKYLDDQYYHFR
jgi:mono/diheme cytochrome c family protein